MTLKVNSSMEGDTVVFALCGRIREAQVAELDALFTSAQTDRNIIVDIANVKLIHRAAVRFLAQQEDKGFTLRNCPAYIREWISRERSGSNNQ